MWKIKQIFDGDYGCEEPLPGAKPKVSVTLVNDAGEEKYISVEDDWLTERGLDEGSAWPEDILDFQNGARQSGSLQIGGQKP